MKKDEVGKVGKGGYMFQNSKLHKMTTEIKLQLTEEELAGLWQGLEEYLFRLGFRLFLGAVSEEEAQAHKAVKALKAKIEGHIRPEVLARLKAEQGSPQAQTDENNPSQGLPF